MSVAVETFGFFMAALGLLMLGVTLPNSYWRVSTVHGSVITTNTIFENLWFSCATDSLGVYSCREFPSLLALSGYLQACRALMITAIFLGFLGLFLGMVGLRCINIGGMELSRKAKLAATAGVLHILAGFCGMVAISWYAFNITREFFDPLYPGTKYELGPALYLGWSASLLAILGGVCLGSGCCRAPDATPAPRLPTMPPRCGPPASLTACAPRPRTKKATAPLANTGRTPTCRTPVDPLPPSPCRERREVPLAAGRGPRPDCAPRPGATPSPDHAPAPPPAAAPPPPRGEDPAC